MSLKRSLLSSVFFALPLLSGSALAGDQNSQPAEGHSAGAETLAQLRAECEAFANNGQIIAFERQLICDGSYTEWKEERSEATIGNSAQIYADLNTKSSAYRIATMERTVGAANSTVQCSVWKKYKMVAPEGLNLKVVVSSCADLNPTTVAQLCKDKVQDYCTTQHEAAGKTASGSSSSDEGQQTEMCTLAEVQKMDGCAMHQGSEEIPQQQQQQGKGQQARR